MFVLLCWPEAKKSFPNENAVFFFHIYMFLYLLDGVKTIEEEKGRYLYEKECVCYLIYDVDFRVRFLQNVCCFVHRRNGTARFLLR